MDLQALAKTLLGKLSRVRKNGEPTEDPNATSGYMEPFPSGPVSTLPAVKPISPITYGRRPDPMELQGAMDMRSNALQTLQGPAPKLGQPKIDGTEAAVSGIVGLLSGNPAAAAKAFAVPGANAQARSDVDNQNTLNQFNQSQRVAQTQLDTSQKVIAEWYDRDAAADKIEADIRKQEIKGKVQEFVAKAKNDVQLVKSLSQLAATGGVTVPAVKEILSLLDPDSSEDELDAKAQALVTDIQANPSMQARMKQAQVEINQGKLAETETKRLWDDLQNPNATFAQQYQVARQLQASGQIAPEVDLTTFLEKMGAQSQNAQAGADLKKQQEELAKEKTNYQKELNKVLPEKLAADLAHKLASADHLRNLDQQASANFDFKQKEAIAKERNSLNKSILTTLQSGYGSEVNNINSLRTSRREWEKKLADLGERKPENAKDYDTFQDQVEEYDAAIAAAKKRLNAINEQADRIRRDMEGEEMEGTDVPQPQVTLPPAGDSRPTKAETRETDSILKGSIRGKKPAAKDPGKGIKLPSNMKLVKQ